MFSELHGLVQKTVGLAEPLRRALAPLSSQILVAFVYGSVAKGTDTAGSDIDLMIIADNNHEKEIDGIFSILPLKIHFLFFTFQEFLTVITQYPIVFTFFSFNCPSFSCV